MVRTRLMGQRVVALCGPDAARFFYDEDHVRRNTALPGPVKSTLVGHGAVHPLEPPPRTPPVSTRPPSPGPATNAASP
ncbi:hypothetical protein GCM10017600_62170 [Streptosporangium carneum]|uniref:Uncharacterized protein n=1 Tax=Streptosporangium carneum TaxID=47481 RepID=A0A9W6MG62_9ACTN|nr:hypothetical protein GCM10017600_62170 [Streptosporangium carneum]